MGTSTLISGASAPAIESVSELADGDDVNGFGRIGLEFATELTDVRIDWIILAGLFVGIPLTCFQAEQAQ